MKKKVGNSGVWDVTDFSRITESMTVNAVYETIGLAYTLINDQQEYRVSAGTMAQTTEELFIPAVHENKPVTVIAENAFMGEIDNSYNFKLAHLPESISEIRASAFYFCQQLQSIKIPSKVTKIGDWAFYYCSCLTTVEMPNVTMLGQMAFRLCTSLQAVEMPLVKTIGGYAFWECTALTTVVMPQVTEFAWCVFSGCTALEHLEIPSSVKTLSSGLFENCTSLKYVILPSGITDIGDAVFSGCTVFEAIYFKGDANTWSALDKSKAGEVFNDAKVYYFAAQMPAQNEGDYWHYDADNKTPVVWKKEG